MRGYRRVWSRRSLATLAIAQISAGLTFYVPVSALFLTGRGLDYGQIFILESVLVGSIAVLEIPSSILADRIGRRPLIVVGYVFNALAQCFFAFGHDYAAFAFSFSLSGAGIALLSGAEESYVYEALGDSAEEVSTGVFGHFNALGIVAGVVASVVGGLLAERGIQWPPLAAAVAAVVAAVVASTLPPDAVRGKSLKSGETSSHGSKLGLALRAVFRTPVLLYAAFASSAGFVLLNAVYTLNQAMFIVAGLPVAFWGAVVALALVIAAILSQQVDLIERKLGKTRVVVIATLVAAAGFALMALGSQPSVVGGFLLVILGWNSRGPVLTALVNTLVQSDVRATTLSIVSLLGSVVGVGLNPVIGWLADASPWLACLGIAGVTASLGVGWIPVMKHQDSLRAAHSSLTSESDGTGCD